MAGKKYMFRSISLILVLVASVSAKDYAGYAGSYLRIGTSARSVAMGSAFTAEIDRGFAAFHNPAGVVFLEQRQFTVLHHSLPLDRRFNATSFSTSLPPTAGLGVAWVTAGVGGIDGRSSSGIHTEDYSTSEDAVYVTFANRLAEDFSLGLNIKILFHRIPVYSDELSGSGTGFDAGVMYRGIPNLTLALTVQDINSRYSWKTSEVLDDEGSVYFDYFPTYYRGGFSYRKNNLLISADYAYIVDIQEGYYLGSEVRAGGEYRWNDNYFVRAGIGNTRLAMGVGMNYSLLNKLDAFIDYAFAYELPTGLAHVFTFAFNF